MCCRLLKLPVAPAAAFDQQPPGKQPLQDVNGRHDPPPLLPAPLPLPPQTQAQASDLTVHSHAGTLRSNEPVSINVGSIANAYFASAPGADRMSVWGGSQYSPAQEASQAAALGSHPSFTRLHGAAAERQSTNPDDRFSARAEAAPFASNYMNGIPWETDSAASPLPSLPQQLLGSAVGVVGTHADTSISNHNGHGQRHVMGTSSKPVHSSGDSNASSSANSKRSRGCHNNQQAAGAIARRPRAAANSPNHAVREAEAGSSGRVGPARSPPRYHQARCAHTHTAAVVPRNLSGAFKGHYSAVPVKVDSYRCFSAALSVSATQCLSLKSVSLHSTLAAYRQSGCPAMRTAGGLLSPCLQQQGLHWMVMYPRTCYAHSLDLVDAHANLLEYLDLC